MTDKSLIDVLDPKPYSTIMIYDVHASESGALAILDDLYKQIKVYPDKTIKWIFVVSVPKYEENENIVVKRFPWVKKNWGYRYYFDNVTTPKLISEYNPQKILSLQNKGIPFYKKEQTVYLHLPFILTDYKFSIKEDGKKLWIYQNVVSKMIFKSLRTVDCVVVQTRWMKEALVKKAGVEDNRIIVLKPDITINCIGRYVDSKDNKKRFFYPATAFSYKNHMTLLKAVNELQKEGFKDYQVIFTISEHENKYTESLAQYIKECQLNVLMMGSIPRRDVFEFYTKSTLVFPSYVESFGLPLLEAKMTGAPIIASDTTFCHEILSDYHKVVFFKEKDYLHLKELLCMQLETAGD